MSGEQDRAALVATVANILNRRTGGHMGSPSWMPCAEEIVAAFGDRLAALEKERDELFEHRAILRALLDALALERSGLDPDRAGGGR